MTTRWTAALGGGGKIDVRFLSGRGIGEFFFEDLGGGTFFFFWELVWIFYGEWSPFFFFCVFFKEK